MVANELDTLDTRGAHDPLEALDSISQAQWERLSRATILFAHHSVGRNILAGVQRVVEERSGVQLALLPITPGQVRDGPGLFHFSAGANGDPAGKLAGFAEVMDSALGARADLALCKLCYADIGPGVEAEPVFAVYCEALQRLESRHPGTQFIHPTIPLRTPRGAKARLKNVAMRALGRPAHPDPNIARNRYNALLHEAYAGRAAIFDIALEESTRADASRSLDPRVSSPVYVMAPEWTDDGGHLGEAGQHRLGAVLVGLLARLSP